MKTRFKGTGEGLDSEGSMDEEVTRDTMDFQTRVGGTQGTRGELHRDTSPWEEGAEGVGMEPFILGTLQSVTPLFEPCLKTPVWSLLIWFHRTVTVSPDPSEGRQLRHSNRKSLSPVSVPGFGLCCWCLMRRE